RSAGHASAHHRCEMVRLAIADEPGFVLSDIEVRSAERSYTVDTVRALVAANPQVSDWFLLLGDDCTAKLHHWVGVDELLERVRIININRHGHLPDARVRD